MRQFNKFFDRNFFLISYKLLHDVLFALLLLLAFTLLAEELIPGIISEHVGISKMIVAIVLNIFLINSAYRFMENPAAEIPLGKKQKTGQKTLLAIALFGILLLVNSFLKIGFLLNTLLVIQTVAIAYLLYAITFRK